jgi:hypothetical protein
VLGGGTPFFPALVKRLDIELIETQTFSQVECLRYRRGYPLIKACSHPRRRARRQVGATAEGRAQHRQIAYYDTAPREAVPCAALRAAVSWHPRT